MITNNITAYAEKLLTAAVEQSFPQGIAVDPDFKSFIQQCSSEFMDEEILNSLQKSGNTIIAQLISEMKRLHARQIAKLFIPPNQTTTEPIPELVDLIITQITPHVTYDDFNNKIIILSHMYQQPQYQFINKHGVNIKLLATDLESIDNKILQQSTKESSNTINNMPGSHMLPAQQKQQFITVLLYIEYQLKIKSDSILVKRKTDLINTINEHIEAATNEYASCATESQFNSWRIHNTYNNISKQVTEAMQYATDTLDKIPGSTLLTDQDKKKFTNKLTILKQKEQQYQNAQHWFTRSITPYQEQEIQQCIKQIHEAIFDTVKQTDNTKIIFNKYQQQLMNNNMENTLLKEALDNQLLAAIATAELNDLGFKTAPINLSHIIRTFDIAILLSHIDYFKNLDLDVQIQIIDSINNLLNQTQKQELITQHDSIKKIINAIAKKCKPTVTSVPLQENDTLWWKNIVNNLNNTSIYHLGIDGMNIMAKTYNIMPNSMIGWLTFYSNPRWYVIINLGKANIISTLSNMIYPFKYIANGFITIAVTMATALYATIQSDPYKPSKKATAILGDEEKAKKVADFFKQEILSLQTQINEPVNNLDPAQLALNLACLNQSWGSIQQGNTDLATLKQLFKNLTLNTDTTWSMTMDNIDTDDMVHNLIDLILPQAPASTGNQKDNLPRLIGPRRQLISYAAQNHAAQQKQLALDKIKDIDSILQHKNTACSH